MLSIFQDAVVEGIGNVHSTIFVERQTAHFGYMFLDCTCVPPGSEEFAGTIEFDDATVSILPDIGLSLIAHSQGNRTYTDRK